MNNAKLEYDHIHAHFNPSAETEFIPVKWHANALELFGKNNFKGKRTLEVGCGVGRFSIFLKDLGANVTGSDFSDSAVEIARKTSASEQKNVEFLVADAQRLPFEDGLFDLVVCCECLEHIPDPEKALREMYRVLKKGGQLLLTTENYFNGYLLLWIKSWIRKKPFTSAEYTQPIDHFFLHWRVKKMIEKAGFEVKRTVSSHFLFFLIPGFNPVKLAIEKFRIYGMNKLFKGVGRHYAFLCLKNPV